MEVVGVLDQEPALDVACPVCGAAFDLDDDGERAWRGLDDPGHWC